VGGGGGRKISCLCIADASLSPLERGGESDRVAGWA